MYPIDPTAQLAALATPLTPIPEGEVLTASQWQTLLAICDAFLTPTSKTDHAVTELERYQPSGVDDNLLIDYLAEKPSSIPAFKASLHRRLGYSVPKEGLKALAFILDALNSRLGSLLITSSATPIHLLDLSARISVLQSWSTARLSPLRGLFRSLSALSRQTWSGTSPALRRFLDFPATPAHIERNDSFQFSFMDFTKSDDRPITLETDVVIVGSGCGAGVAALHLASAGLKVLVLEKSYHFPSSHFPMDSSSAPNHLFDTDHGTITDDQTQAVLNGSTWGGGGTVNWSASLQPQHFVREEWANEGLAFATSPEFQDCLDTVCDHMGVARSNDEHALGQIEQNFANKTLLEGARRLGYFGEVVPQNTAGKRHHCGYCGEGCASTTKQGPANYWLPKAAEKDAQFVEGCWVEEILFEDIPASPDSSGLNSYFTVPPSTPRPTRKAIGVKALWTSRDRQTTVPLTITAKRTIIAAGTLNSPLILLRSGLTNPHIGRNLHLHPTSALGAVWPQRVNPWEGAILTSAVTSLENLDGAFHGPKLECLASTPGYMLPWFPIRFPPNLAPPPPQSSPSKTTTKTDVATTFKLTVAKFAHMTNYISLQRDRDTGRVYLDGADKSRRRFRIAYTLSRRDLAGLTAGVVALARIAYAMGAREIHTVSASTPPFVRSETNPQGDDDDNDARFASWLAAFGSRGLDAEGVFGSAHQMGTCRMASGPEKGVVDSGGRVWGTRGLYVCDASLFPSASGVNPMVTTMGLAEWVCRGIVREEGGSGK